MKGSDPIDDRIYHRYQIVTKKASNIIPFPHRFCVKVSKFGLAKLLFKEILQTRGNLEVVFSRPCVYGVFSGPLGGFSPRENLCVGCLRCTTQYPEVVTILKNPALALLGDSYFTPAHIETVAYESETGHIPIRGAGYRGKFGGSGWDGLWTDMSEIVRPTRDGIHGREFISTEVDIGERPPFLRFDEQGKLLAASPSIITIPIPLLFDLPPVGNNTQEIRLIWEEAAHQLQTFAILPVDSIVKFSLKNPSLIPLVSKSEIEKCTALSFEPKFIELNHWHEQTYQQLKQRFPHTIIILRTHFEGEDLIACYSAGVRVFHLTANYHGQDPKGSFVLDLIRKAHQSFVAAEVRNEVTLIGSGGIIAAEHVPKAILCGLDAVALDTPLMIALQGKFKGMCLDCNHSSFHLPKKIPVSWGVQRLKNLVSSWRDQLIEILGAMGLREVRRLRGEVGRAMFEKDLEAEAFAEIKRTDA
jgi:Conserved region in glutamate synthase